MVLGTAYTSPREFLINGLDQRFAAMPQRVGDKFYRETGDVLHADHNAALNVLERLDDPDREVRRILLARSPAQLSVNRGVPPRGDFMWPSGG